MNNNFFIKKVEGLRKRAWDLIDTLEKLERELDNSVDAGKRRSLQVRIENARRLLKDYKSKYEAMCEKSTGTSILDNDSSTSRNIKNDQNVDLPPLFLVPSRNPMFRGRQNEVQKVIQQVLKGGAFAICGSKGKGVGGVGKTEIAKEVCYIFHETWQEQPDLPENLTALLGQKEGGFFRDGILWIHFHLEGQNPKSLTDDLISLLIKQCPMIGKKIANLDTMADVLGAKDILMVLDNVEQNLRTFDYVLERFKGSFPLLITSRIAIPGIKSIDIDVLTDKEAEDLFLCYMDIPQLPEEEQEIVREFCRLLDNYPLPIKIIASLVKKDKSNLAELLDTYKEKRKYLLDTVRTCFMMSFNSLNEEEQHIVRHAALFNNSFTNSFTAEALIGLLDVIIDKEEKEKKLKELDCIVNQLERLAMINCLYGGGGHENTYQLHPMIREFALDLLMQTVEIIPGRKEESETLLKELHQAKKEKTLAKQLEQDPSFVQQIVDAVQYCDQTYDFPAVLKFMKVLDGQLDNLSYWGERLRLNQSAIRAAVALRQEFDEGIYRKQRADIEKQQAMFKNTFDFVGRKKELDYFEDEFLFCLGSFILNIHTDGNGGIGKTQLLQQMLKLCRSRYADRVISSEELIDFYYTEARSKAGIIGQIISKLGIDHFSRVARQLERYRRTKDSSERQYILDDAVTALRKDYAVFSALSERARKNIILFFDTYEVVQFVDKEKDTVKRSDYSEWLEEELFPALQTDNTRLVIAGRYPLINAAEGSVVTKSLFLFEDGEAIDFLAEYLKIAEFSKDEYQSFLGDFPQAEDLLQEFRYDLDAERIGVQIYKFSNRYREELGEEVWQALKNKVPVKKEKELLDALKLTREELTTVIELAQRRPIYLALFMDWVHFSKGEPGKLVREVQNVAEGEAQRELFENTILEWLRDDPVREKYIDYMAVAYRRMTAEIMQHLTGDSPEHCEKILLEDIRHFSFTKYKKDEEKGDVVLLHDEMRDLIIKRWQNEFDPDQEQKKEILKKLIRYYEENLLSLDYILTDFSCRRLEQQDIPKGVIDKIKNIDSLYFTKDDFISALQGQDELTQDELDSYFPEIVKAAAQEVLQEKREVYTPELIEYAFIIDADDGVQRFCDEFDTAMEDGRSSYAGLLGRETELCCAQYGASLASELEVNLREVEYYIDGDKRDIPRALRIIASAHEKKHTDISWKGSLLFGKFKLWEGVAYFWLDKFDEAILLLKEAKGIFLAHENQEDQTFFALNWIGYTYYRKADFAEAEIWMQQSLNGLLTLLAREVKGETRRKKRNFHQRIQYVYGNLAMLYRYTGRFTESTRNAEAAHCIVKSLPRNKKEIFRSLNTLAHVLAVAGRSMDARSYLEQAKKIYKEIPDPLLGGRLLSNYCWLTHDALESAYMIEYYRAKELRYAVDRTYSKQSSLRAEQLGSSVEHTEDAVKILDGRAGTPIFYKELADASFKLGELYMMTPETWRPEKWREAEQAFVQAKKIAELSQFRYSYIDALESLVGLYYFWNHAAENVSNDTKTENKQKQEQYRKQLEVDLCSEMECYPNLMGRYELTLGNIAFDSALDRLQANTTTSDTDCAEEINRLKEAFSHYFSAALYKKKFNKDRYFLILRVCYNRLITLIKKQRVIAEQILAWMKKNPAKWQDNISEFEEIFEYIVLLQIKEKDDSQGTIERLKQAIQQAEENGDYRHAVLLNKCLIDGYRLQAKSNESEVYQEKVACRLSRQSRLYRLLGDVHYTRLCYGRARDAIKGKDIEAKVEITDPVLKQGLEGFTDIVKGEFYFRQGGYGSLLEIYLRDELPSARDRFDRQFPGAREKALTLFKQGEKQLEQTREEFSRRSNSAKETEQKEILEDRIRFYHQQSAEAYFQLGELQMMNGHFRENEQDGLGAFEYLKKSITACEASGHHDRHDDAKQSYLNAVYFAGCDDDPAYQKAIEQELEEKINAEDYKYPRVAARFRIIQGDELFSNCFQMEEPTDESDSENYRFVPRKAPVGREDLLPMFRCYVEACNYKAGFNDLSFEAGLRVLRRRIELIADSSSLDILYEILRHIWQDGKHLRKKSEELESILQLIKMRSLTRKLVQEYER